MHRSRLLRRWITLAALSLAAAPLSPAEPESDPNAHARFDGVLTGAFFGCHAPYTGPGVVGLTLNVGGAIGKPPPTTLLYALERMLFVPDAIEPRLHQVTGEWWILGANAAKTEVWLTEEPGFVWGRREFTSAEQAASNSHFSALTLEGRGEIVHYNAKGDQVGRCGVVWEFGGLQREPPPRPPTKKKWTPVGKRARVQAELSGARKSRAGVEVRETVAVTPCAPATACFAYTANAAPELLVRSRPAGGRDVVLYLPLGPRAAEVWSLGPGETLAQARSWLVPPASGTGVARAGYVDLVGYPLAEAADTLTSRGEDEGAPPGGIRSLAAELATRGNAPPPAGPWLTTPALPGFRFKARLGNAALVVARACPRGTLCLGATATAPAEVFARVTGRQANGKRWVLAGKFADAGASLWVQQGTSGPIRQYSLAPRDPESAWLPALVDRTAFKG